MSSKATFEVYRDHADEWRWRLVHRNGNIIADSGEGYASKQKAEEGIESVKTNAREAPVVDVEE
ncbi:HVO_2922 family protein [Halobaculum marinum]|uniref:HVO_2922 family protein n=1 Tax=Halobaculum marinum TaxID=3031996 RepID=A0ABD5WWS9_9EURY|nr:HVO_2922 family protein [Halobaculum sp. DT55]